LKIHWLTYVNLDAARLCDEAKGGQIPVTERVAAAVGLIVALEEIGNLSDRSLSPNGLPPQSG
jgi:class 3 adenylate cyclase